MEIIDEPFDSKAVVHAAGKRMKSAFVHYVSELSVLVDIGTLYEGNHGFDFALAVDPETLHEVSQKVTELEWRVRESHGVHFRTILLPQSTGER